MFNGDQATGKEGAQCENGVRRGTKYDGSIPELAIRTLFGLFGQPNLSKYVPINAHKFGHNPKFKKMNLNADL